MHTKVESLQLDIPALYSTYKQIVKPHKTKLQL